jgi:serine/threonine-protein kinase
MAPEQARMQPTDRRADVFSLGVVLYELLADVKPFRGNSLQEITTAVLEHEPPLASVVDPRVPRALADIAAQAMAKDPEHRYRSARAFARELRHWLEENVGPDGGVATALPDDKPKRSRHLAAVAGVAVLGAAAVWFALVSQRDAAPAGAVAATAPATLPAAAARPTVVPVLAAPAVAAVATAAPAAAQGPAPVASVAAQPVVVVAPAQPKATPPTAAARPAVNEPPKESPKESPKDRRIREARERELRVAAAKPTAAKPAAPLATGVVRIAVSPWGHVEVDGASAGTTPPLNELTLPEGPHKITLRNEDFPAHTTTVNVVAGQPVSVKHKFGS